MTDLIPAPPPILQPLGPKPLEPPVRGLGIDGFYVPSTPDTVRWGTLPNREAAPVLTVPSGAVITFDTVSHEGLLPDQGRDPVNWFGQNEIQPSEILADVKSLASSVVLPEFPPHGAHLVTGPVAIEGSQSGDVLKIEALSLQPRVPYGIISIRKGKGALPGGLPRLADRSGITTWDNFGEQKSVSILIRLRESKGTLCGILNTLDRGEIRFSIRPFMGIMGVASNTTHQVSSIPPAEYGGNLDIKELGTGSTLYLPIQVPGALFFTGDPHYVQGNGEVCQTALEGSLRTTFRLSILKSGDPAIPCRGSLAQPFAETRDHWIPVGLDPDLDAAMEMAVRVAIQFLSSNLGMDPVTAYAYLSARADFEVSQVVNRTKGIHGLIPKSDFANHPDIPTPPRLVLS